LGFEWKKLEAPGFQHGCKKNSRKKKHKGKKNEQGDKEAKKKNKQILRRFGAGLMKNTVKNNKHQKQRFVAKKSKKIAPGKG